MNFFKKNFNIFAKMRDAISYWGIDENANEFEKNFTILINQFQFFLFLTFLIHSICIAIFLGFTIDSIYLAAVSLVMLLSMLLKERRKNKYILISTFIFLCLVITYYSSYSGQESGIFLFYFPLALALAFFFDINKDKSLILFILFFILVCLYLTVIFDFTLVAKTSLIINNFEKKNMLMSVTFSTLFFGLAYYFIEEKKEALYTFYQLNKKNALEVEHLKNEVEKLLKNTSLTQNLTEKNITEIVTLAQRNDPFFLEKFQLHLPDFFKSLKENSESELLISDLHLCAMMKLNFTNKQIAIYTNTTTKSVESKKYRLRKKLNIPQDKDLTVWISNL